MFIISDHLWQLFSCGSIWYTIYISLKNMQCKQSVHNTTRVSRVKCYCHANVRPKASKSWGFKYQLIINNNKQKGMQNIFMLKRTIAFTVYRAEWTDPLNGSNAYEWLLVRLFKKVSLLSSRDEISIIRRHLMLWLPSKRESSKCVLTRLS